MDIAGGTAIAGGGSGGARVGCAGELQRRLGRRPVRVRQVVHGAVKGADAVQPPQDVPVPVPARQASVPADREEDPAAGPNELMGELGVYLRRSGFDVAVANDIPAPWGAALAGRWRESASGVGATR